MHSAKVVTPVKAGVQFFRNYPKRLDSGFCRNDGTSQILTFYEIVNIASTRLSLRLRLPSC
jgi:hypothetical protein